MCVLLQGTLTECASPAPAAVQLSGALVELIRSPAVHQHAEAFVRRAALVAASQVCCSPNEHMKHQQNGIANAIAHASDNLTIEIATCDAIGRSTST